MPPSDAFIHQQLAAAQQMARAGHLDRAMAQLGAIIATAPWRLEPYLGCGSICLSTGQFEDAVSWFERARKLAPNLPPVLEGLGQALLALGRSREALAVFQTLQARDPKSDVAFHGAGEALKQLGRIAEARAALERAVALAPEMAGHHYALAQIARFVENDPRLAGLENLARKAGALAEPDRCELYFALAKAYDELGRPAEAFAHWQKANALKHRAVGYNEAMYLGILRDLEAAFTPALMASRQGAGDPSELPVFVVGMPRSGTTLVEQIIASHPQAFGAGEKMHLHHLLGQNLAGPEFPAHLADVSEVALRAMGARYVALLQHDAPQAARITDKLTANFMLCGLINLILPNAKIIHVQRDPLDTCFSCFTNLFSQSIDYSYDLGELGRYYRAYERLMAHWRQVLPQGAMLEVSYEKLVGDLDTEVRRIMAYTGLAWDDACLSFHRTKRVVHTLSAAQVRQPLYRSAIGRAAPYAPWLEPLRRTLAGS